jgi:hypothetical protein
MMKDNLELKYQKMLSILKILKISMKWQKLEKVVESQLLDFLKLMELQKEIKIFFQRLFLAM